MLLAVLGDSKLMTAWDYDARLAENFQATFGALVTKFAEQSSPEHAELGKQLEKAAKDRNDLAHHYFWDRAVGFCSSEGRAQMIEELAGIGSSFESLDEEVSELARAIVQQRGLTKEALQAHMDIHIEELLSGAEKPIRPERVPNPIEINAAYEWRAGNAVRCKLVLSSNDGRYLVLGERGLCYGPQNIPVKELVAKAHFSMALPATLSPRPKKSAPWNYAIILGNGYILRVKPGEINGKPVCRFGLHEAKQ